MHTGVGLRQPHYDEALSMPHRAGSGFRRSAFRELLCRRRCGAAGAARRRVRAGPSACTAWAGAGLGRRAGRLAPGPPGAPGAAHGPGARQRPRVVCARPAPPRRPGGAWQRPAAGGLHRRRAGHHGGQRAAGAGPPARPLLVENLSAYLHWADDSLAEPDFFNELARRSGCGVLLDVNNLVVNALNEHAATKPPRWPAACRWVDAMRPGQRGRDPPGRLRRQRQTWSSTTTAAACTRRCGRSTHTPCAGWARGRR
jgi:hypothetical protein